MDHVDPRGRIIQNDEALVMRENASGMGRNLGWVAIKNNPYSLDSQDLACAPATLTPVTTMTAMDTARPSLRIFS